MIKKLLSTVALCALFTGANAQSDRVLTPIANGEIKTAFTPYESKKGGSGVNVSAAIVQDTLEYFFNKHVFRNANGAQFIGANVPFQFTNTPVSHIASRFFNTSTVAVTGAECVVAKKSTSTTNTITVKLRLCLIVAGNPQLPGLDSVNAVVNNAGTNGWFAGGDFPNGPHVLTSDFAIVAQNASPNAGDTATFYMTNGSVPSATAGTIPVGSKFGEGLSWFRAAGTWTTTQGFWGTANIPFASSSMEYCLSPRVTYTATADHATVPTTVCPQAQVIYNNTSTSLINNRQFNMNKFVQVWAPFTATNNPSSTSDSVFVFDAGDGQGMFYDMNHIHYYTTIGVYTSTLTANIRKMNFPNIAAGTASSVKFAETKNNTIQTILACGPLGIANYNTVEGINIYPNPSNNGYVNITNLSNESTIELVNMLGQTVSKSKVNGGNHSFDYSHLPKGTYFVKISANNEKTKLTKLILN